MEVDGVLVVGFMHTGNGSWKLNGRGSMSSSPHKSNHSNE